MKQAKKLLSMLLITVIAFSVAVPGSAAEGGYSDVSKTDWYYDAVQYMTGSGLMNGTGGGTFTPQGELTRAMLATVFYRMAGEPAVTGEDAFEDTAAGTWYSDAVLWASREKLVEGYGNGRFGTNDPVTQEQLVTILWRYAGEPAAKESAADASPWAASAVAWARESKTVNESVGYTFAPRENASRAQIAAILSAYLTGQDSNASILIVYFAVAENSDVDAVSSASVVVDNGEAKGMSKFIADIIAERTGGELFSIRTENQYPGVYNDLADYAKNEQDNGILPVITDKLENLDDYDVIFIGYPIWWYTMPQAMYSFFEEYDFSGKTIIPFDTHYGSGNGGTFRRIAELEPDAEVKEGLAVHQNSVSSSRQTVVEWLEGLGY